MEMAEGLALRRGSQRVGLCWRTAAHGVRGSRGEGLVDAARDVNMLGSICTRARGWVGGASHRVQSRARRAGKPGCALPGVKLLAGR